MNFKKTLALASAAAMIFSSSAAYAKTMEFTMGSTNLYISDNGISKALIETAPYTENDRTMVPVRIISENFGATVSWNELTSEVTIENGSNKIVLTLGKNEAVVNGASVALDVPANEIGGRTMVPLRFISENLGKDVSYVEATEQVLITDEAPVLTVNGKTYNIEDYRYIFNNLKLNSATSDVKKVEVVTNYLTESGVFSSLCEKENYTSVPGSDLDAIAQYLEEQKEYIYQSSLVAPGARFHSENTLALMYLSQKSEEAAALADLESIYNSEYIMANHILILTQDEATGEPLDEAGKKKAKKLADNILSRLKKGEDFDKLCKEYTQDPGYALNPEGYIFTKGEMVQEFETAAFELKVGEISNVVETSYGYHILQKKALPEMSEEFREIISYYVTAGMFDELYNEMMSTAECQLHLSNEEIAALLTK